MDERIRKISSYYGFRSQEMQLMEEMGELIQAVSKFERAENPPEAYETMQAIIEELVDVQIMIEQFRELLNVSDERFEEIYNNKLERQIKRIGYAKRRAQQQIMPRVRRLPKKDAKKLKAMVGGTHE